MAGIHAMLLGTGDIFVFKHYIAAHLTNYNVRDYATAAGWNGVRPLFADIEIAPGYYLSASDPSVYAFHTSNGYPPGSIIRLKNRGFIIGAGGYGGRGSANQSGAGWGGGGGGPALGAGWYITIDNTGGTIGGGGGGGGGGQGVSVQFPIDPKLGGGSAEYRAAGGGGGGGRSNLAMNTAPGSGGWSAGASAPASGGDGATGYYTGAGGGGGGGNSGGMAFGGAGGSGGSWGTNGGNGGSGSWVGGASSAGGYGGPYAGGPGGPAVQGNSLITWVAAGTRLGALL
jgi:hypothetical protein